MQLIDHDQLLELRTMLGPRLDAMVETLGASAAEALATMRGALASGDLAALAHAAHRLKGGAGALGATGLADGAARVERLAREGDGVTATVALDTLATLVDPTIAALRAP